MGLANAVETEGAGGVIDAALACGDWIAKRFDESGCSLQCNRDLIAGGFTTVEAEWATRRRRLDRADEEAALAAVIYRRAGAGSG